MIMTCNSAVASLMLSRFFGICWRVKKKYHSPNMVSSIYAPRNKVVGGYTGFTMSVRL
jgi:hypothetical protein